MANLAIESEDPQLAERHAMLLHRITRARTQTEDYRGVELLGPSPAAIQRVKKKYRWHLGLLSRSPKRLNALTRAVREDFQEQCQSRKVKLKVDLDPYGVY